MFLFECKKNFWGPKFTTGKLAIIEYNPINVYFLVLVKLGIWEATLAEYIESIEDVTDVSILYISHLLMRSHSHVNKYI